MRRGRSTFPFSNQWRGDYPHHGEDLEFHATKNSHGTRKRVAERICQLENIKVHTLWIDKRYTHPSKQDAVELFTIFGTAMGKWLGTVVASEHDVD
jgi:hypothetical protein